MYHVLCLTAKVVREHADPALFLVSATATYTLVVMQHMSPIRLAQRGIREESLTALFFRELAEIHIAL